MYKSQLLETGTSVKKSGCLKFVGFCIVTSLGVNTEGCDGTFKSHSSFITIVSSGETIGLDKAILYRVLLVPVDDCVTFIPDPTKLETDDVANPF